MNLLQEPRLNHQVEVTGEVMSEQCGAVISKFFKRRREEKKAAKLAARNA
jgi:tRNA(adenine34) deaminase